MYIYTRDDVLSSVYSVYYKFFDWSDIVSNQAKLWPDITEI